MFDFGIKDIIDIVAVALGLYYIYRVMKASRSLNVFGGIIVFFIMWIFVSRVFEMRLLGAILDNLMSVGVIALIIIFQDEIRKFFYNVGAHQSFSALLKFFSGGKRKSNVDKESVMTIVRSCMSMGRGKVGALIVIERVTPLDDIVEIFPNPAQRACNGINQKAVDREHLLQELSTARRRYGGVEAENKGSRMYSPREPRCEYPERTGTAPPCCYGNLRGE